MTARLSAARMSLTTRRKWAEGSQRSTSGRRQRPPSSWWRTLGSAPSCGGRSGSASGRNSCVSSRSIAWWWVKGQTQKHCSDTSYTYTFCLSRQCYKSSKEQTPLLDVSLLGCTVVYKEKQPKKKEHKLKITPVGGEAIVLGLQSKEQTEQWLKVKATVCMDGLVVSGGIARQGGHRGGPWLLLIGWWYINIKTHIFSCRNIFVGGKTYAIAKRLVVYQPLL